MGSWEVLGSQGLSLSHFAWQAAVGGIIVHYTAHLQSPVWRLRAYHSCFLPFAIYFDIQNSIWILVELELGFSHLCTCSGGQEPELAIVLFTCSPLGSPGVPGHIIHRWKGVFKEITAPL